ncbi:hypothetical protein GJ496_003362 [Pomphorhynchus laevis]|nr:hypothetical protein GJ496_003362 [Pomphorhynchus laevis]
MDQEGNSLMSRNDSDDNREKIELTQKVDEERTNYSDEFRRNVRLWWPRLSTDPMQKPMYHLIPDRLDEDELAAICQTHELMDWNTDGKVNASRICDVAKNLNFHFDEEDADMFVKMNDLNNDGYLDFGEMLFAFAKLKRIERYKRERRYELVNNITDIINGPDFNPVTENFNFTEVPLKNVRTEAFYFQRNK